MYHIKKLCVAGVFILLTSCNYISSHNTLIKNNDSNYLKAKNLAPLKIPPGLSSSTFQNHYPVSEQSYSAAAEKVSIKPPE